MFQIFLPGVQTQRDDALRRAGLGDLVPDAFWWEGAGPEGLPGAIAGWRPPGQTTRIGYYPECQRWVPAVADGDLPAGRYWIGFWEGEQLGPSLLARRQQFAGSRLPLTASGETWLIPAAERFPRAMRLTDQGLLLQVQESLRPFAAAAAEWGHRVMSVAISERDGLPVPRWPFFEFFDFCSAALRLNYCLTPEVISELELIMTDNVQSIVMAVLSGD